MTVTLNEIHQRTADDKATIPRIQKLGLVEPTVCKNCCTEEKGSPRRMSIGRMTATRFVAVCNQCVHKKTTTTKITVMVKLQFPRIRFSPTPS